MGVNRLFSCFTAKMEDQKHKENQSQQASQTSPVGNGEGMGSSCAQTEKTES